MTRRGLLEDRLALFELVDKLILDERAVLYNGQKRHGCLGIVSRPYRLLGGIAVTDRQAMAFAVLHLGDPADLGPDPATVEELCFEIPGHHEGRVVVATDHEIAGCQVPVDQRDLAPSRC